MKNVQFSCYSIFNKNWICAWTENTPQSDKAICFKHLQQNQSTGSFSLTFKKNIINIHELQNFNSLFEKKKKLADRLAN